ncbi:Uncharacterised protein [Mycobacterium tuberculosis]|nr:Uncharacterised protein [Mycobacterium tuberculosis]
MGAASAASASDRSGRVSISQPVAANRWVRQSRYWGISIIGKVA